MTMTGLIDGVNPHEERCRFISAFLNIKPDDKILEIGTGTGTNLSLINEHNGSVGALVGLDRSIPMLKQAQKKLERNTSYGLLGGNANILPFESGTFDLVFVFGGFNHLLNQKETIKEMMRVTKVGGMIVVSDKSLAMFKGGKIRKALMKLLEPDLILPPPFAAIPTSTARIHCRWLWNDLFYVFHFQNPAVSKD